MIDPVTVKLGWYHLMLVVKRVDSAAYSVGSVPVSTGGGTSSGSVPGSGNSG